MFAGANDGGHMVVKVKKVKKVSGVSILGIDQSLNGTAIVHTINGVMKDYWFCTDKNRNLCNKSICINIAKINEYERLIVIREWFKKILEKVDPEYVGIEGYAFGGTGRAFQLGELGGMLKIMVYEHGCKFLTLPPNSVKLFATGKGNATKAMMVVDAVTKHDVNFTSHMENAEDLADAFWINQLIFSILECRREPKLLKKIPAYQKQAIADKAKKKGSKSLLETEFIRR
jgi:Holliday junction resolvasome RuvABC endonuclease subunit